MSILDEAIKFPEWNGHKRRNDILQTLDDNQKLIVISNPKRPFWNAIFHFLFPRWIGKKYEYKVKVTDK